MSRPLVERAFRVPFVRSCVVVPGGRDPYRALIVNISVLGCYLASEEPVNVGQTHRVRFTVPGNILESEIVGAVIWVNTTQEHPVHSLPAGFGLRFLGLDARTRLRIDGVVRDYLLRHPESERE